MNLPGLARVEVDPDLGLFCSEADARALVAAVEAAAEVEANSTSDYVVGRGGSGQWRVRVELADMKRLSAALAPFRGGA